VLSMREWDGDATLWGPPRQLSLEGLAYGAVNDPEIFGTVPGGEINVYTGEAMLDQTFGEAIFNLTQIFSADCRVFTSGFVKGRTSTPFTAVLKDFIAPVPVEIDTCRTVDLPNEASADASNPGQEPVADSGLVSVSNDPVLAEDTDGDGLRNFSDLDDDSDGVLDVVDNCPFAANPTQADSDLDGLGDACDGPTLGLVKIVDSVDCLGLVSWSGVESTFVGTHLHAIEGRALPSVPFLEDAVLGMTSVRDVSGNGVPELAAFGIADDGRLRVQVRDSETGQFVKNQFFFTDSWTPLDIGTLADLGSDGSDDIALLARNLSTGEIGVQVRDAASGTFVRNVFFVDPGWRAQQLVVIDDLDANPGQEVGVLATNDAGQIVVMVKDAKTNSFIKNVFFLNANWRPVQALVLPDFSGNGADEIALLAQNRNSGQLVVAVKDSATNTFLGNVFPLGAGWAPYRLAMLPDENGNSAAELALLAGNLATGKLVVQVLDSGTGEVLRDFAPLGSNWTPRGMVTIPDVDGQPGLSILAVRKSDGLRVLQTVKAGSGELVSNMVLR